MGNNLEPTKVVMVAALASMAAIPKPRFLGFGVQTRDFSIGNLGPFNTGMGLGDSSKSLFFLKGFSVQTFGAIPKVGQLDDVISMDGELVVDLTSQLNGTRRSVAVLLIQPCKMANVMEFGLI